jgi:LysM repeat protein
MRQVKRLIYIILLNIIVSAGTVLLILNLWERSHPPIFATNAPQVVLVTSTQSANLPLVSNQPGSTNELIPTDTGVIITGTLPATQSIDVVIYEVKEGDTLGALAIQFNISVADIMTVNGLTDPDSIYLGQTLRIPTSPLPTITPTPTPTTPPSVTPRPSVTSTQGPTATVAPTQPGQEAQLVIQTVIGTGVLANEHVVLQRTGDGELSLAGWRVEDGAGNAFIFPELTLYKGVSINLNTRQGEDSVLDLFWELNYTVWKSGKTVLLYDAQNHLRSSYTIP